MRVRRATSNAQSLESVAWVEEENEMDVERGFDPELRSFCT